MDFVSQETIERIEPLSRHKNIVSQSMKDSIKAPNDKEKVEADMEEIIEKLDKQAMLEEKRDEENKQKQEELEAAYGSLYYTEMPKVKCNRFEKEEKT